MIFSIVLAGCDMHFSSIAKLVKHDIYNVINGSMEYEHRLFIENLTKKKKKKNVHINVIGVNLDHSSYIVYGCPQCNIWFSAVLSKGRLCGEVLVIVF